jgi:GTP pyrophosphokinase
MNWRQLAAAVKKENPALNLSRLEKAYRFAFHAHKGQVRYSGEPYITHPVAVAGLLLSWKQPQLVIEAALLHDCLENEQVSQQQIEKEFGAELASLVSGVAKLGGVRLRGSTESMFVENLRKMFVAMAADIRVVIIRLADRMHNMQTLEAVPLAKQQRIAHETLEIYAPLAERLGMGQIKGSLEDLAFPYAYPEEQTWLDTIANPHFATATRATNKLIRDIQFALTRAGVEAEVHGRPKRRYSLYCKLQRPSIGRDISKIHDLIALRIVTQSTRDCYAALGIVHNVWKPAPQIGISDFIAQPKPNGYRSIHTKVFDHRGQIFEVQIRTDEMHLEAEYGAAAHFAYAEAKAAGVDDHRLEQGTAFSVDSKMAWVKQLAAWQQQVSDSEEFVSALKLDALSHRIYVFSPKGDVFDLPAEATPVDFAYAVHTNLINYIQGAKVNGKVVPLNSPLNSGDVVEILKTKNPRRPTRDWLKFIKTTRARTKIQKLLKQED